MAAQEHGRALRRLRERWGSAWLLFGWLVLLHLLMYGLWRHQLLLVAVTAPGVFAGLVWRRRGRDSARLPQAARRRLRRLARAEYATEAALLGLLAWRLWTHAGGGLAVLTIGGLVASRLAFGRLRRAVLEA